MQREEINDRRIEFVNSIKTVMETLNWDIQTVEKSDSLSEICSKVGNNIDHLKRLTGELEAELNDLEVLQELEDELNSKETEKDAAVFGNARIYGNTEITDCTKKIGGSTQICDGAIKIDAPKRTRKSR